MNDKKGGKEEEIFNCVFCNVFTCDKWKFRRHLLTAKHARMTLECPKDYKKGSSKIFQCGCGREYKYRQGLSKHQKNCENKKGSDEPENNTDIKALTDLVLTVVKQNQDLSNKLVDICSNPPSTISNSNINSNNKTFNLQIFLNETCKDAINITDFVNSIKLQLSDLENIGQNGFVEGISNIVNNNLKDLDTKQRPIHCSDLKREVFYIKDDNQWVKDDEPKNKISKVIKQIAHKNIQQIPEWVKKNPDCFDYSSKQNDKYLKIVSNSMSGGTTTEQQNNINKIISNVAKKVTINKN